ncbi:Hypothetical predicted protein [Mytilus galloprovincialis]|uniref:Uncharacterized protein n=1 Tax=Mytilus galloprovincialis TaxID=29158 RepID=A0A8B6E357_MYTGA|nr:Hypothetical predicted protein [Mytilus galloprovincialis]
MDSHAINILIGCLVGVFVIALIIIIIVAEFCLRRRKIRKARANNRLDVNGSTNLQGYIKAQKAIPAKRQRKYRLFRYLNSLKANPVKRTRFVEEQTVSTTLQSRQLSQNSLDYLASKPVHTKQNGISSVRYYEVGDGKPLAVEYYTVNPLNAEKILYQPEGQLVQPSDERDNIEQTIAYPTSEIDASSDDSSYQVDMSTQTRDIPSNVSNEYSITALVENNPVTIIEHVQNKIISSSSCTQTLQAETQATQTFQSESQCTQTVPIEAQSTQTIQIETQPEKKPEPTVTTTNTQTPYSVSYPSDSDRIKSSDNYQHEKQYEQWMDYYHGPHQEYPYMEPYPADMMPFMYPTDEAYPYYYDQDVYSIASSVSEKPVKKRREKVEKTKIIEKYIVIQQPPPVQTIVREDNTQKVETNVTQSSAVDVYKSNKYKDYFGQFSNNEISLSRMNAKNQSKANGGPRSSAQNGQNKSKSSGMKHGKALISEKDLHRIWNTRHQTRQHGSNGSIKLEVPPDFLKQVRYDTNVQEIPPADYDTNESNIYSGENETGVLQRYLKDVSDHSEQTNVRNGGLLNQSSQCQPNSGSTRFSGIISHMGSYRPDADTMMHRNQRLQPQVVDILPDDVPMRPDELHRSTMYPS